MMYGEFGKNNNQTNSKPEGINLFNRLSFPQVS